MSRTCSWIFVLFLIPWDAVVAANSWRVVNGSKARQGQFKFMASLPNCSASIIGPTTILTAAHCVCKGGPSEVIVGVTEKWGNSPDKQVFSVASYQSHPKYPAGQCVVHAHDIAVVKLRSAIRMTANVNTIPINCNTRYPPGTQIINLGYGLDERSQSGVLKYGYNRIAKCPYDPNLMCSDKSPNHILYGDSGGPVVTPKGSGFEQVGVNSGIGGQSVYAPTISSCDFIRRFM